MQHSVSGRLRSVILRQHEAAAIVAGRQTQIRRVARWPKFIRTEADMQEAAEAINKSKTGVVIERGPCDGIKHRLAHALGRPGDILVGREVYALEQSVDGDDEPPYSDGRPIKWRPESDVEGWKPRWIQAHYRATDPAPDLYCEDRETPGCRWRSPVCMPLWAARIRQPIKRVWVERVQDISEADAVSNGVRADSDWLAEGIRITGQSCNWLNPEGEMYPTAASAYAALWESDHGPGSWDANPWVWCCEFERYSR